MFIYIELSQIYKSIFKLTINYSNSHIVQDERKQISCESPLAWIRLDAAWMQLCLWLKISRNIGVFGIYIRGLHRFLLIRAKLRSTHK